MSRESCRWCRTDAIALVGSNLYGRERVEPLCERHWRSAPYRTVVIRVLQ